MIKLKFILPFFLILFIFSCASAPDESSSDSSTIDVAPETTPNKTEEATKEDLSSDSVDEDLITNAKKAIFKAEEAKAETYYPKRLSDLKAKLEKVYEIKDSDPDKARILLKEIQEEADKLMNDSWDALKKECINILNDKTEQLLKIEADKYTKEEFKITQDAKDLAMESFKTGEFTSSTQAYRDAYTSLTNLYNALSTNISYIDSLLKTINNYKAEGESINAGKWAPDEYMGAVDKYNIGIDLLYNKYDLTDGEETLREVVFLAKTCIEQARINIELAETDREIFNLMAGLEDASILTVLDEDDNIIEPKEWKGKVELVDNPIEAEVELDQESGLEEIELEKDVKVEFPVTKGKSGVLGMKEKRKNLLQEAKDLWKQGIDARNAGDLIKANEYLSKAKVYLDEYKSMAVDYIYTVVLDPSKRDCLWRIAGKEDFYGDPFLWQQIWERNKSLIQDPDLIYPGWKLIIPPLD